MSNLERKNKKLQNNKDSILFNRTCLNEKMLSKYTFFKYTHIPTHTHTYIYIYIERERERASLKLNGPIATNWALCQRGPVLECNLLSAH